MDSSTEDWLDAAILAAAASTDDVPVAVEMNPPSGALMRRRLPDGRYVDVTAMTYGKGRLCIGDEVDLFAYRDGYCYTSIAQAVVAAVTWDGEGDPPEGWIRHLGSGRRRPDGTPESEYVAP